MFNTSATTAQILLRRSGRHVAVRNQQRRLYSPDVGVHRFQHLADVGRCLRIAAFLQQIPAGGTQIVIELHTADRDDAPPFATFKKECEQYLPRFIPVGVTLVVRRWKRRDGGDRPHNRYILTDIGGVQFAAGFGEGEAGTSDDVLRLSAETYHRRLEEYAGPKYAFDLDGEFNVAPGPEPRTR